MATHVGKQFLIVGSLVIEITWFFKKFKALCRTGLEIFGELPEKLCWARLVGSFLQMLLLLASFGIERQTLYRLDFSLQTNFWKWFCLLLVCVKVPCGHPPPTGSVARRPRPRGFSEQFAAWVAESVFFAIFSAALISLRLSVYYWVAYVPLWHCLVLEW